MIIFLSMPTNGTNYQSKRIVLEGEMRVTKKEGSNINHNETASVPKLSNKKYK